MVAHVSWRAPRLHHRATTCCVGPGNDGTLRRSENDGTLSLHKGFGKVDSRANTQNTSSQQSPCELCSLIFSKRGTLPCSRFRHLETMTSIRNRGFILIQLNSPTLAPPFDFGVTCNVEICRPHTCTQCWVGLESVGRNLMSKTRVSTPSIAVQTSQTV